MGRISFVTWDGGGNVPPAIGIAQALAARGHTCQFLGYESQRERIEAKGFRFSSFEQSGGFDVRRHPPDQRIPMLLRHVWSCPEHLSDLPAALTKAPADVVVIDFMMHGALAAGERIDTPVAALAHSAIAGLVPPPESPIALTWTAASNRARAAGAMAPLEHLNDAWEPFMALVTTLRELDPAATEQGPQVRYVGPIFEGFDDTPWESPWSSDDHRPLVLVSFSTTGFWDQRGRLRSTLAALEAEQVRVLLCAPEASELGALPSNATALRFVPHARVLPQAALTITHCGHGTIAASLRHGVPVVGLPNQAADQPFLARRVQELGAGVALEGDAAPERIRAAVRNVLVNPSYAAAARSLAEAITRSPGAEGAASELERAWR